MASAHVRFGSLADMTALISDDRFAPDNGHAPDGSGCPLSANKRHSRGLGLYQNTRLSRYDAVS
jgi:hypothetical protein